MIQSQIIKKLYKTRILLIYVFLRIQILLLCIQTCFKYSRLDTTLCLPVDPGRTGACCSWCSHQSLSSWRYVLTGWTRYHSPCNGAWHSLQQTKPSSWNILVVILHKLIHGLVTLSAWRNGEDGTGGLRGSLLVKILKFNIHV